MSAWSFILTLPPSAKLIIAAPFAAYWLAGVACEQLVNRYWFAPCRRLARRWYGTGCHVAVLGEPHEPWEVVSWENLSGPVFVKLASLDDEDPRLRWLALGDIAPLSVPVFRPRLSRRGLSLRSYRPVPDVAR